MKHTPLLVVALAMTGIPLACASEGAPAADPRPDADAAPVSPAGDAGPTSEDGGSRVDPCSTSKLCVAPVPIENNIRLMSVWGSSAGDVWAVGSGGTIIHYDGTAWETADPIADRDGSASDFTLRSVWLERPDDVWIAGGHSIRHSSGWKGPSRTEWSFRTQRFSGCVPAAVRGKADTVWVALGVSQDSVCDWLLRFEGGLDGGPYAFSDRGPRPFRYPVALAMSRADEAWVSTSVPSWPGASENRLVRIMLTGQDADSATNMWGFEQYDMSTNLAALAIWGDEQAIWLVGEGGMLRRLNRTDLATKRFEAVPSPVTDDLHGVFGFGADDVWAVGEASTVLHWDGTTWTKLTTPFDQAGVKPGFVAVWGSSPGDVWIAGSGTMLHYQENGQ